MNSLQLDEIVQQIEQSFGKNLPISGAATTAAENEIFGRLLQEDVFQLYIQDQVNRQIIRDYLVNAVMLGCITDENFTALSIRAQSREQRATLSLHMLMTAVEDANEIAGELEPKGLKALRPLPGSPPHMVIVGS